MAFNDGLIDKKEKQKAERSLMLETNFIVLTEKTSGGTLHKVALSPGTIVFIEPKGDYDEMSKVHFCIGSDHCTVLVKENIDEIGAKVYEMHSKRKSRAKAFDQNKGVEAPVEKQQGTVGVVRRR